MKTKLLIYFLPALFVSFLIFGYSTQDDPSSDANNIDSKIQQQVNEMTSSNNPRFLAPGMQTDALAPVADTILYKGPIPAYPAGCFGIASNWLGDTLYVCGGGAAGAASVDVYRYSITSESWSTGVSLPVAKTGGSLVKCGNALYYIGGGSALSGTTATANTFRYRVGFGWDEVAPIPTPVVGNAGACWNDSVIYCLAGGWSQYYRGTQIYRPSNNTWSRASDSLPAGTGRRSLAGGIVGDKLFIACGFSGAFRKDMYVGTISGDGSTVAWAAGPQVPCRGTGMSRPGGTGFDGHFYVIGAETTPAPLQQDSIFIFNANTNTWLTPLSGRGTGAASNYWGSISAKDVNGKTTVFIPGGNVTGVTTWGLYVATSRGTPPPPGGTITVCRNGINVAVPDNGGNANPGVDSIVISGIPAGQEIKKITVTVDTVITTWVGDLRFWLTKGSLVDTVISRIGWTGTGFGNSCDNFTGTVLLDSAGLTNIQNIPTACNGILAQATGKFNPKSPLAPFQNSATNPNGNYTLRISDNAAGDLAFLRAWCVKIEYGLITGVGNNVSSIPNDFSLSQNYPNPFNPATTINYSIPKSGLVTLKVYDLLGKEVASLVNEVKSAGNHTLNFNASYLSSGVYFYRLESGNFIDTKKMFLLK